ncbi:hypothetical protein [Luteolibacter luteus]|uniref:Uncharacterized protein n=1 Tax=Luteolibacter luteus TaxID=2728835 RepID=A0A858RCP8_9BACT|nr:hypothetical protein [Luteolibacter luteus]QJE94502.1 hypothetical protein HHL09_01430 [Luteolibacter luteus]
MKNIFNPFLVAFAGFSSLALMTSCSKEARQEAAAESAVETSVDVTEDYCELLESIKDKDSAKAAIDKMDGLADKFAKVAEKAKKAEGAAPDAATIAKTQEKMAPLQERMGKAVVSAMAIIGSDPELLKAFQEKQTLIGAKIQEAATK